MTSPVVDLNSVTLSVGSRRLWEGLDLKVAAGEFLGVIGPNGSGKTSLLKAILGELTPTSGSIRVLGVPAGRKNHRIGYVPQLRGASQGIGVRGKDFVAFGIDGHRWGLPIRSRRVKSQVNSALTGLDAIELANVPVGLLSGGQFQKLRIAQALVDEPKLLLCDEPFLSLDLGAQAKVIQAIQAERLKLETAIVLVTHDVNPIVDLVDRLLYFNGKQFILGTPEQVLRPEILSEIYGSKVEVKTIRGRITVTGISDLPSSHEHELSVGAES